MAVALQLPELVCFTQADDSTEQQQRQQQQQQGVDPSHRAVNAAQPRQQQLQQQLQRLTFVAACSSYS